MAKKRINVSIDEELYWRAKRVGISLSTFLENRLREFLNGELNVCGGRDLNPRTPTGLGPQPSAFGQAWQPPPYILLNLNH